MEIALTRAQTQAAERVQDELVVSGVSADGMLWISPFGEFGGGFGVVKLRYYRNRADGYVSVLLLRDGRVIEP